VSDGLKLCANCHDVYTTGRLCRLCAEQEQIDDLVPDAPPFQWERLEEPDAQIEQAKLFLAWLSKHWYNPTSPDNDV